MKFKLEKDFQTEFGKWVIKTDPKRTEIYELKLVRSGNFRIQAWIKTQPHQARGLMEAKNDGCFHKISDESRGLKPWDCQWIRDEVAVLVIYFNKEEQFIMIDIEDALRLTKTNKTASFEILSEIGICCHL